MTVLKMATEHVAPYIQSGGLYTIAAFRKKKDQQPLNMDRLTP